MSEWSASYFLGYAFFAWIGMACGWYLCRRQYGPPPPKPHKHNWVFTRCADGVLRTCVECGESKIDMYSDIRTRQ